MTDLVFELEDDLIGELRRIARSKGQSLEDYCRDLIIAEANRSPGDEPTHQASK